MRNALIARRYAKAIFELVASDQYTTILDDMEAIETAFIQDAEMFSICSSPLLSKKQRLSIVDVLTQTLEHHTIWKQTLLILLNKKRVDILYAIFQEIKKIIRQAQNKQLVSITLARETDDETLQSIKKHVESMLKSEIDIEVRIDKSILGGFIAETETMRLDGSILYNVNQFKTMMQTI